ncbi:MAG: hypothetical protein WDN26_04935 [Chitinophagaceae bacterium]
MNSGIININWKQGKALYLALWLGAAMTILIIATGADNTFTTKQLFKKEAMAPSEASDEAINDLLLSVDELNIAEKNSFINLYLKPNEHARVQLNVQDRRDSFYRQILNRRLSRLENRKRNEDFSVKPVPQ